MEAAAIPQSAIAEERLLDRTHLRPNRTHASLETQLPKRLGPHRVNQMA
jgi:hypothetical protein